MKSMRIAAVSGILAITAATAAGWTPAPASSPPAPVDAAAPEAPRPSPLLPPAVRSTVGRSGALEVLLAMPGERVTLPVRWDGAAPEGAWVRWRRVGEQDPAGAGADARVLRSGAAATVLPGRRSLEAAREALPLAPDLRAQVPGAPGIYAVEVGAGREARLVGGLHVIVQVPFESKRDGRIDGYLIGRYPTEGEPRGGRYTLPEGFIRVDRETADLRLSEHFRLREFLTHDQGDAWPKFVVVSPRLLDKLELVMDELERSGTRAEHMIVMSGFRTPQYNKRGLSAGRASLSRHQWGDAADVWVDNDGDWYMDDLNGDGRRDTRDARVMLRAVERVEAAHPELVGGAGIYPDNGAHGPFIHIDTRGRVARW